MFFTIQRRWFCKGNKTPGTAVNAACQVNFSAGLFGHACHRFGSPGPVTVQTELSQHRKGECTFIEPNFYFNRGYKIGRAV